MHCDRCGDSEGPEPVTELLEWVNREAANGERDQTEVGWGDFPFKARMVRH